MSRVLFWNERGEPADGTILPGTVQMYLDEADGFVKYKLPSNAIRILGRADFLLLAGGTMSGDIDMDGNKILNAIVNGVTLTAAGAANKFLNEVGNYVLPASATNNYYQAFNAGAGENPNNVVPVSISFPTVDQSQPWITDTSPTVKTIEEAGEYVITYAVLMAKPVPAPVTLEFDLFVNGTQTLEHSVPGPLAGNNFNLYESVSRVKQNLVATDTIEIKGFRLQGNTGQTLVLPTTTRLTIFKVA